MSAVMVLPVWPGASFFPTFWPDGDHTADFVSKMEFINPCFECGPMVTGSSMRWFKPYKTAVLEVDFREPLARNKLFCLKGGCRLCKR